MRKNTYLALILLVLMLILIIFPQLCLQSAQKGLLLWFNKVLPSLLPFMILINILVPLDGLKGLIATATPVTWKIWHLPGYSFFAFIMGLIASYPMGAKIVKQLYDSSKLTKKEAELTLCFSNNCGPLFIVGTIGTAMLSSTSLGYFLLFIHILSALIMSFLITRHYTQEKGYLNPVQADSDSPSFASLLNKGVINAMDTIVCVGGYIILFSVITSLLTDTSLMTSFISLFSSSPAAKSAFTGIVAGLLELSNGSYQFSLLPLSIYSLASISAVIGFGGLCVYFQTLYVLEGCNLATTPYFISKCFQGLLSFGLTLLIYPFFSLYTQSTLIQTSIHSTFIGFLIICITTFFVSHIFHSSQSVPADSDYLAASHIISSKK